MGQHGDHREVEATWGQHGNNVGTMGMWRPHGCCDMNQSDTIGKIELIPSIVLSSDNTDCKNDIQLFPQLFDELSVHTDYH